jgi:altronate hydrolase
MDRQDKLTIRLNSTDNVVIALRDVAPGVEDQKHKLIIRDHIPAGHKIATEKIAKGAFIRKYGQIIGVASLNIHSGEHVHTHNLEMGYFNRSYEIGTEVRPTNYFSEEDQASFDGIVRDDGRIATRNYIGVLPTVACSASVCRYIADALNRDILNTYPNVDGIVGITHTSGCGMAPNGPGFENLQLSLAGYANHPNFWGVLFVGLGCEVNQLKLLFNNNHLTKNAKLRTLSIQESGGTEATINRGVEIIKEMLPQANQLKRQPVSASHLILGLECGGSDAYSGISANPVLGAAADLVVRNGGTVILSETTEVYGAEHLLIQRASSQEVANKLIDLIHWWEKYTEINGAMINNNPTPGNKAGGLTTILEKSLGAVAKSGSVAGGANIICFTTGCGTVLGSKPTPVIKLASNTEMFQRLSGDMDIDCGLVISGKKTIEEMGATTFKKILDTASISKTKSEAFGFGDNEFVPWQIGAIV